MRTLVLDPSGSGITGEMLAAAVIDLAGSAKPLALLCDVFSGSPYCHRCNLEFRPPATAGQIGVLTLDVDGSGGTEPADLSGEAERLSKRVGLSENACRILHGAVHDLLTFDPAATFKDIAEILVPLMLIDRAGLLECAVCSLPPAAGLPASPVIALYAHHRIPLSQSSLDRPYTTVAGAALLAHLADVTNTFPGMTPKGNFYGEDGRGNILRIIEGETDDLVEERIVLLETNIDDVTAEVMSYTQRRLLREGAVDVYITPTLGKKGRPEHVLTVITNRRIYRHLTRVLMEETGTLGVRIYEVPRLVADRQRSPVSCEIAGSLFDIRVKRSSVGGLPIAVKPEYEDLKKAAEKTGLPLRIVSAIVHNEMEDRGLSLNERTNPPVPE